MMAAVDLSGETNCPLPYAIASQGTTWQEIKIPSWAARVSVYASAAAWVSWVCGITGATEPADGGASGSTTHKFTHVGSAVFEVRHDDQGYTDTSVVRATSIYVASKASTVAIELVFEQARG